MTDRTRVPEKGRDKKREKEMEGDRKTHISIYAHTCTYIHAHKNAHTYGHIHTHTVAQTYSHM